MDNIHLTVINPDESTNYDRVVDYNRNDVRWISVIGGYGAAFRIIPLRWCDDASYAAYQARDIED